MNYTFFQVPARVEDDCVGIVAVIEVKMFDALRVGYLEHVGSLLCVRNTLFCDQLLPEGVWLATEEDESVSLIGNDFIDVFAVKFALPSFQYV